MADDAKTLLIKVDAAVGLAQSNLRKLERQIETLEKGGNSSLKKFDDGVKRSTTGIIGGFGKAQTAFSAFAGGFAGGLLSALPGTLFAAAQASLELGSSLYETSLQLGVSVEDLQKYRFVADQLGITQEDLDKGLKKLTLSIGQAASGSKKQKSAFDELGISLTDASGATKTAGVVLPELVAALSKIPDPAKRAAAEVAIFGKAGQSLEPLLGGGIKQLNQLSDEYRKLGIALSTDQAKKLDDSADALAKFKTQAQGEFTIFLAESGVLDELVSGLKATREELKYIYDAYKRVRDILGLGVPVNVPSAPARPVTASDYSKPATGPRRSSDSDFLKRPRGPQKSGIAFPGFLNLAIDVESVVAAAGGSTPPVALQAITSEARRLGAALDDVLPDFRELLEGLNPLDNTDKSTLYSDLGIDGGDFQRAFDEAEARKDAAFEANEQIAEDFRAKMDARTELLAGTFEDLFNNGFDNVLDNFRRGGLAVAAQIVARLAINALSGQKSDFGAIALGAFGKVFGGGFAEGGSPPVGKISLVGERGPELFVPRVAGTVISNDNLRGVGGGSSIALTINAPGATAETIMMIRRELANAVPAIVGAAQTRTVRAVSRQRLG